MMLGSRMYYEFTDHTPATLARSITQLKKEIDTHIARRDDVPIGKSGSDVKVIEVAPMRSASIKGNRLLDMTVDDVCAFCKDHKVPELSDAIRKHGIDGRAIAQLLRCSDNNTITYAATLQTSLGTATLGPVLRFVYEINLTFSSTLHAL
jgi:hypothetical protein